jgi:hypothetical protein
VRRSETERARDVRFSRTNGSTGFGLARRATELAGCLLILGATLAAPADAPRAQEPPASPGQTCSTRFVARGTRLVRGTVEPGVPIAEALPNEIVALAPGAEITGVPEGRLVRVTAPVVGEFRGSIARRCTDTPPTVAIDVTSPPTVALPEGARAVHDVSLDVDDDGAADHVQTWVNEDEDRAIVQVVLSRGQTTTSFRIRLDDGITTACFGVVDGRLAYLQSITRGSSSGVRAHVLRAEGAWRPAPGLVGRAIAGVLGDEGAALVPPASSALWQGSIDDWLASPLTRCPERGRAIDVARDGHYPIDADRGANELALLRVRDLATSFRGLPRGAGPVVELQTTSSE